MVSAPPTTKGFPTAVLVVCGTFLAAFVFAGYVYLEVRGRSNASITALIVQVLAAVPGVLAWIAARRANAGVDVVAQQTNGTLRSTQQLATRALSELEPRKANAIVREVAAASPGDEGAHGTIARSPGS